ncbi:MAG TPA: indole-3-glycerol phosphate synthase TrpC [Syntrophorhabdaceae bacterium]|nr:indole-3-glycerol phosphate synthase TrpC [Syntrophorhabdaceae bacterium]HQM82157.1 indole-3-glycerol phosphate synthase TrpC [Syntrophorhabdaceae bacterium]
MIDAILEMKRKEIEGLKGRQCPPRKKPFIPLVFGDGVNIIAELKRRSPSAGTIAEIDEERIAVYSRYAKGISVLTDTTYFGGSFELLEKVAEKTPLPILCKDFIIDESQIELACSMGADIVLLIARILDKERLKTLYLYARELGLNCLVEIHRKEEIDRIDVLQPEIIGVNARDLDTFRIDLGLVEDMLSCVDAPMRIAESGIKSRRDIKRLSGANGFLIGEALMKSREPESVFRELLYV